MTTIDEKRGERLSHVAWMALKRCIGGRSKIIGQWRANWITSGGLLISWNDKRTPFRPTFVILRYRGIMYRGGGVSYDYIHMVMRAERRYLARRGWSVINNLGGGLSGNRPLSGCASPPGCSTARPSSFDSKTTVEILSRRYRTMPAFLRSKWTLSLSPGENGWIFIGRL